MKKGKKLYEGKAKVIFATENKDFVIQHFKTMQQLLIIKKEQKLKAKGF